MYRSFYITDSISHDRSPYRPSSMRFHKKFLGGRPRESRRKETQPRSEFVGGGQGPTVSVLRVQVSLFLHKKQKTNKQKRVLKVVFRVSVE